MNDTPPDDTPPADEADISAPIEGAHRDRLAKVMARAGLASRRDAEVWITDGRVAVNGRQVTEPGTTVGPEDRIAVDGAPLPRRERTRLWLYHKPRGLVTTARDPQGRPTVFEVLPSTLPRVISVGRLDLNTEGLLLLTNDGGLARVLSHPDTAWLRRYRVRAYGHVTADRLQALSKGVEIDGFQYSGIEARIDREQGDNMWLTLGLREGKNREVRRVLEHLGLRVNRLIRLSFGPFQLDDLPEGAVEEVRTRHLRDQIGDLADKAGCDFSAPVVMREEAPPSRKPAADEEGRRRRAGLVTDRRGRRVLVERYENDTQPEKKHAPARPPRGEERKAGPRTAGGPPGRVRTPGFVDRPGTEGRGEDRRGSRPSFDKPNREGHSGSRPPRREGDERPFRRDRDEQGRGHGRNFDAPSRPYAARPSAGEGRPPRRDDRPRETREGDSRPPRAASGHGSRPRSQHVFRTSSTPRPERPFDPRADDDRRHDERPRGGRPEREYQGDRPRTERPRGERPRGDRPQGDRPYRERPQGGRPQGDRPYRERPPGDRPRGERSREERPFGRPHGERRPTGDRPQGGRPYGDRPQGDRPQGKRPYGDRPQGDRPQGDRPFRDKGPRSDRPQGGRPQGGRPQGDRPGGRPGGNRPGGRPGGKGPGGGRPGGNRPGGTGRPGGGKPPGGRRPPPRG